MCLSPTVSQSQAQSQQLGPQGDKLADLLVTFRAAVRQQAVSLKAEERAALLKLCDGVRDAAPTAGIRLEDRRDGGSWKVAAVANTTDAGSSDNIYFGRL